jgi:hypothetical protein
MFSVPIYVHTDPLLFWRIHHLMDAPLQHAAIRTLTARAEPVSIN